MIPTSRTKENSVITLHPSLCNGCGKCVSVCKGFNLEIADGKAIVLPHSFYGCIGCGHCMAICPTDAIEVSKREISSESLFPIPPKDSILQYDPLVALLQHRRSIREFKKKEVEPSVIEKIIEAAKTAPMGIPPSDVQLLVFNTREKNIRFAKDFSEYLKGMKYMTSKIVLKLFGVFWGKETSEFFTQFFKPLFQAYTHEMDKGNNLINYDAPLGMYFYGTPYCDPADPIIAATYAMIAAESLGLGSCMLGAIHPFIQNGNRAKKFREKHGIKFKSREGLFIIFGYPSVKYKHGIKRTFASVSEYDAKKSKVE